MLPYAHTKLVGGSKQPVTGCEESQMWLLPKNKGIIHDLFPEYNLDSAASEEARLLKMRLSGFWMKTSVSIPVAAVIISEPGVD